MHEICATSHDQFRHTGCCVSLYVCQCMCLELWKLLERLMLSHNFHTLEEGLGACWQPSLMA